MILHLVITYSILVLVYQDVGALHTLINS